MYHAFADPGARSSARRNSSIALRLGREASLLVCDRGYLKHQRAWRAQVADRAGCRVVQVESDVVVPVEAASGKAEIGARTLRPKIHRQLPSYLVNLPAARVRASTIDLDIRGLDLNETDNLLKNLKIDRSVGPVPFFFKGGTSEAKRRFASFVQERLERYDRNHNQPQTDDISHMSPYLHFGQISPLYLALEVAEAPVPRAAKDAFLEEMIVRRELACNFTHYTPTYDSYGCLPGWARQASQLPPHA